MITMDAGCTQPLVPTHPRPQRGAALLIMLVILIVGATAMLLNSLSSTALRLERDRITAAALVQAKEALIGFSISYGDTHPNQVSGFLPLPDLGTSRNSLPSEG